MLKIIKLLKNCDENEYNKIKAETFLNIPWEEAQGFLKKYPKYENEIFACSGFYNIIMIKDLYFMEVVDLNIVPNVWEQIKSNKDNEKSLFNRIPKQYLFYVFLNFDWNSINQKDKIDILINSRKRMEYNFQEFDTLFTIPILKNKFDYEDKEIRIYRGESSKSTNYTEALSWTTNYNIAKFFANRFNEKRKIYKAKTNMKNILFVDKENYENEILVESKFIYDIKEIENDNDNG